MKRLLLVEDEFLIATNEIVQLKKYGYDVIHVSSGEKALVIADKSFDLILMDINLGNGIDGTETAIEILKQYDIPIVFLSSHVDPEVVEKTEKITSYGYVVKNSGITILDASIKMAFKLFDAHRSLTAEKNKIDAILEHSPIGFAANTISDGKKLFISIKFKEIYGIDSSESVDDFFNLVYLNPTFREEIKERILKDISSGDPSKMKWEDIPITTKDGTNKYITAINIPIPDQDLMLSTVQDVTEKKTAQLDLKNSETRFRNAFYSSPFPIMIRDESGKIEYLNNTWTELTGYTIEDIPTTKIWAEKAYGSQKEKVLELMKLSIEGQKYNSEMEVRAKNGDLMVWEFNSAPLDDLSSKKAITIAKNITHQKNIENILYEYNARFELAMKSANMAWWEMDIETGAVIFDIRKTNMIGKNSSDFKHYTDFMKLLHPEDCEKAMEAMRKHLSGEVEKYEVEYRIQTATGEYKWFYDIGGIVRKDNAKPTRVAGIVMDISDRKASENEKRLNENSLKRLVNILQHPANTVQEFLDYALEQALQLTDSKFGYIYHYNHDKQQFILNTWSKDVMDSCKVQYPETCYELGNTGFWGKTVRQRRPIVLNDFAASHPLKKGYPSGHVEIKRFMTVPIFRNDEIVGVVGLANKEQEYHDTNVLQVSLLMESIWKIVDKKRSEIEISNLLKEKETILVEVHHRIKNNIASIEALLTMHSDSLANPEAKIALKDAIGRVNSMRVLYDKLLNTENFKDIPVKSYIEDLCSKIINLFPNSKKVSLEFNINDFNLNSKQLFPLGIIINELFTNIMKYAFKDDGVIKIFLTKKSGEISLTVHDNGIGLPKGFDPNNTDGFGVMLVNMMAQQLYGKFNMENDNGTKSTLVFRELIY